MQTSFDTVYSTIACIKCNRNETLFKHFSLGGVAAHATHIISNKAIIGHHQHGLYKAIGHIIYLFPQKTDKHVLGRI